MLAGDLGGLASLAQRDGADTVAVEMVFAYRSKTMDNPGQKELPEDEAKPACPGKEDGNRLS